MTNPIGPREGSTPGTRPRRDAAVAVVGAGDYIGAAIARRFAREGYTVFAGRRHGDKLAPLVADIEAEGGVCIGRTLDARQEESITRFIADADAAAPLEVAVFNIGANVNFPLLETTERVFRKVWELACYAGFLTGREAARCMLAHGRGSILFTGATASLRGGDGYAAFASAKFGLRALAQSMARELGPKNIHVAHLVIDAGVDTAWVRERILARSGAEAAERLQPDRLVNPASIAETYWQLHQQPRDSWTHELDIRPYREPW
jgi:NAD(P)-dependent dehydrogenase (short-subunit alcohol dehydrogenase family)